MKRFVILCVAAVAMTVMASESQAQYGWQRGGFAPRSGFAISVGSGFYNPGFYGARYNPGFYSGWGHYRPVYRPVVPVYGVGRPHYGGWGGGCRW